MSEEKFSKCEEGEKNISVEFRVFRKKNENKRKVPKKNQSVFELNFFLELKLWFLRKFKIRGFYLLGSYPLVGRHVD